MKLNDEEQDILGGKFGALPQIALQHQKQVGEFFGAADFVPVTQAHIMADTESLGEAGVRWLEELAPMDSGGCAFQPLPIRAAPISQKRIFSVTPRQCSIWSAARLRLSSLSA
jgi:hypothetical protein